MSHLSHLATSPFWQKLGAAGDQCCGAEAGRSPARGIRERAIASATLLESSVGKMQLALQSGFCTLGVQLVMIPALRSPCVWLSFLNTSGVWPATTVHYREG